MGDFVFVAGQALCIAGLLYGAYVSITFCPDQPHPAGRLNFTRFTTPVRHALGAKHGTPPAARLLVAANDPVLRDGENASGAESTRWGERSGAFILSVTALLLAGSLPVAVMIYLGRHLRMHAADR